MKNEDTLGATIYAKAIGDLDPEFDDVPEQLQVKDAFEEGGECSKAYGIVYDYKNQIEEEMQQKFWETRSAEDRAKWKQYEAYLEQITWQMTLIQDEIGRLMYLYGKRAYAFGLDTELDT